MPQYLLNFISPERVLKVEPDEVGFERYLTKDEREKLEEDEKKEAERIRLLNADDAGARAYAIFEYLN